LINPLKNESGYSLVEVLAAIMILTIAIIPMVGMFDAGLRAASTSGNYDKARALANQKLEQAKSLPYDSVRERFPDGDTVVPDNGSAVTSSPRQTDPDSPGFEYSVTKQFVEIENNQVIASDEEDVGLIKITVTTYWQGNSYSTTGLVSI
jgi:Tfp pilus assembly protein PilV